MKIKFYGTRGSIPVCEPGFQEFGGNTTCLKILFEDTGRIGILDAGTGIRKLGRDLQAQDEYQDEIVIAFSHFHWDHIQGFPFFNPAFDPTKKLVLIALGKGREIHNLEEIFTFQMQGAYFPVQMENMGRSWPKSPASRRQRVRIWPRWTRSARRRRPTTTGNTRMTRTPRSRE